MVATNPTDLLSSKARVRQARKEETVVNIGIWEGGRVVVGVDMARIWSDTWMRRGI